MPPVVIGWAIVFVSTLFLVVSLIGFPSSRHLQLVHATIRGTTIRLGIWGYCTQDYWSLNRECFKSTAGYTLRELSHPVLEGLREHLSEEFIKRMTTGIVVANSLATTTSILSILLAPCLLLGGVGKAVWGTILAISIFGTLAALILNAHLVHMFLDAAWGSQAYYGAMGAGSSMVISAFVMQVIAIIFVIFASHDSRW